jgi:polysaccharide export outer membrane protein
MTTLFALLLAAATVPANGPARPSPTPSPAPAAAQASRTPAPAAHPPAAAPDEYRVGPGDVLDVIVFGQDDLTRAPVVQTSGVIALPLLGDVPVAGLTLPEIRAKLIEALGRDFLVHPQVEVKVKEYQSQFVTVLGEVNQPGRKPLKGRMRLIDALVEAGGFTTRASGEVTISRLEGGFEGGGRTLRLQLASGALSPQDQESLELPLRSGDAVTASPKYYVTVEGEVMRPGRYVLESDLTVSGALSLAGGPTRFGSGRLRVRRTDPATGQTRIIEVDLKDVRKGKAEDLPLQANDVVSVSRRIL